MGVPHTRPVLVTTTRHRPGAGARDNPVWIDRVHIPGSFAGMLEYRAGHRDLLARGFVAHVPHYLAQGAFAPPRWPMLRRIIEATGLRPAAEAMASAASMARWPASRPRSARTPRLAPLVRRWRSSTTSCRPGAPAAVPSADEIGAAVEQFLAERDDDDDGLMPAVAELLNDLLSTWSASSPTCSVASTPRPSCSAPSAGR